MDSNKTTETVIGADIEVRREFGPSLPRSTSGAHLVHWGSRGARRPVNNLKENLPPRSLRSPR